jgi:hypothetical protein
MKPFLDACLAGGTDLVTVDPDGWIVWHATGFRELRIRAAPVGLEHEELTRLLLEDQGLAGNVSARE